MKFVHSQGPLPWRTITGLAASAAVAVAAALIPGVAHAEPPNDSAAAADKAAVARAKEAAHLILVGASAEEIKRLTGLVQVGKPSKSVYQVPSISPNGLSEQADVSVAASTYYDDVNRKYTAYIDFNWLDTRTLGDGGFSRSNVGGFDALAVQFSKNVTQVETPSAVAYWGDWRKTSSQVPDPPDTGQEQPEFSDPWSNSQVAASFRWQDRTTAGYCGGADHYTCASYNSQSGIAFYTFTKPAGCLQIFGAYGHTWKDTTVNGVTITLAGPEIQFSSAEESWQRASGAASVDC